MRLDLFLKTSRLIPRRTVAQEFCDKGLVSVNEAVARSSREIKRGDRITIRRRNVLTTIVVTDVPLQKQLSKADASGIYEIVSTTTLDEDDLLS